MRKDPKEVREGGWGQPGGGAVQAEETRDDVHRF